MTIGSGILLIVVGAVLAFGLQVDVPGLDLDVIGWILMAAGAVGMIVGIALHASRTRPRRTHVTDVTENVETPNGEAVVRRTDQRLT